MATFKNGKFGVYGEKTRLLQKRLSFERMSLTLRDYPIYKYMGDKNAIAPSLADIGDLVFMENRDRAYDVSPVIINGWRETPVDNKFDMSRYGLINPIGDEITFMFHIYSFEVDGLGRYLVEGDIIEDTFHMLDGKRAFYEVQDVDRFQENETFMVTVKATPMNHTAETLDIMAMADVPDDNAMAAAMADLETEINALDNDNIDTSDYEVANAQTPETYDPRKQPSADFLDDPDATIF